MPRSPIIEPWRVKSSRLLVKDRWLTLRADDCVTAEGAEISPYYVLEYPDWVQVVAIDDEDRLVLVEQYRHALGVVSLELPGGAVDPEDVGPVGAGARELVEETGYGGGEWRHVASLAANPANQNNRCHVVLAQGVRLTGAPNDDPVERIAVTRLPVDEAIAAAVNGKIIQAIHVAALAVALTAIGRWTD